MQILRSHIAKTSIISLICIGLCLFMARPADAQQSARAFSSWLGTVADNADNGLEKELEKMRESGADVYKLMEHASLVMSNHDKEIDLPLISTDASNRIYQVLLQQWNHFNTGKGMANVPPPEIIKSLISISMEKSGKIFFAMASVNQSAVTSFAFPETVNDLIHFNISFEPMITGIAIGAP